MSEREGIPLSVGEARAVAQQIRDSVTHDRKYWPWVIEELCDRLLKTQGRATCGGSGLDGDARAERLAKAEALLHRLGMILNQLANPREFLRAIERLNDEAKKLLEAKP